ncbi:MAG TPA: hypothetical protein VGI56_01265 [Galbitalea sp.]|jgi:hypothetical protein
MADRYGEPSEYAGYGNGRNPNLPRGRKPAPTAKQAAQDMRRANAREAAGQSPEALPRIRRRGHI